MSDTKKKARPNKVSHYIGGIIGNAILLIILNLLPNWNLSFITEEFPDVLWAINLSLGVQIFGYFVLIFIHPLFLHHLANVVFSAVSLIPIYVLYVVYPLDFTGLGLAWVDKLFKIILIVAFVATVIAVIVHLIKGIRALLGLER